jgi:hypothetical protein
MRSWHQGLLKSLAKCRDSSTTQICLLKTSFILRTVSHR